MPTAYYISVTLHLLAALLWLGGTGLGLDHRAGNHRNHESPPLRSLFAMST